METENKSKQLRLKAIVEKLGLTQSEFAKQAGIRQSNLSEMISGKRPIGENIANKLFISFGINKDWLLKGEVSEAMIDPFFSDTASKNITQKQLPYPVKPFIDSVYAVCGTPSGFSIAIKEAECEGLSLPFMKEYDFSIRAKGDSMINRSNPARSIRDNDIVVCRLWTSRSHVRWGEVYALATGDGVIVKKIMPSDKESFIKCVSFNEEDGYPPYELPLQEVHDWAIVTGVVSARNWN